MYFDPDAVKRHILKEALKFWSAIIGVIVLVCLVTC